MPTISVFYGILIQRYWNDHAPPHFHVRYAESRATFGIDRIEVLTGNLPRNAERLVVEWAQQHKAELKENWRLCELKERPLTIAPLQ